MNRLKRNIVSILMIMSMSFVLFGCSGSGANNSISDKERFVGTWETTVDMTDTINDEIQKARAQADSGLLHLTYDDTGKNEYLSYEFTSDEIKLSDINGKYWKGMLPMILKKAE